MSPVQPDEPGVPFAPADASAGPKDSAAAADPGPGPGFHADDASGTHRPAPTVEQGTGSVPSSDAVPQQQGPFRDAPGEDATGRSGRMSPRALRSALAGGAVAAVVLLVALVALLGGGDDAPATSAPAPPKYGPTRLEVSDVQAQQVALGRPVYWAGKPEAKQSLELTVGADGSNTVRYLSGKKVDAGSARAVAMYPMPQAYQAAQAAARQPGAMSEKVADGLVVGKTSNAYNGYLAVKGLPFLIEVFDPRPGQAWKLLTSGKIVPVPN